MDLLCFCSVLCLLCLCVHLFICALWSPAGKGLTSLSLSHWYPGSGVVLDCLFCLFCCFRFLIFAPLLTFLCHRPYLSPTYKNKIIKKWRMSGHVLLNLLNELGKKIECKALQAFLSLFRNKFNKFIEVVFIGLFCLF